MSKLISELTPLFNIVKRAMSLILFLHLFTLKYYLSLGKSESILIIALPLSDTEVSASWERGQEILPGALAAIEEVKNDSLSFNLTLIVANSGPVTRYNCPYSGNMLEIITNLTRQKRVSDIIGIAGILHPNTLAIINRFQLPTASLIHSKEAPHYSNVHYLTASTSTLTDAILAFLKKIRPKKIGIVTETKQPYLMISNKLRGKADIALPLYVQIVNMHHDFFSSIADRVITSNIHVILLSVGPSTAAHILCEASKRGLTWPKYAWILHSYQLDDLLRSSESTLKEKCNMQKILEGVFIFQLTKEGGNLLIGGARLNPYADLLYDSVRALISSIDGRSFAYLNETPSTFHFNSDTSKVYIYHNTNGTASQRLTAIYDGTSHTLANVSDTHVVFIDTDLPVVYKPTSSTHYLLLPFLSFLLNTILLVLFLYFRKEPSIKSTSVSLSMLIFTGCYLLVGYTFCLILYEVYRFDLCMVQIWLSGTGLSIPLILAAILIKMLRVYRIFKAIKILKRSPFTSDSTLLVYTTLILLPNIVLLILWTAVDPYHRIDNFIEHPNFIRIEINCYCDYKFIWFALQLFYLFLLSAAVIIVAIKSRKIRHANFKDTKKVNLFIFLLFIIVICTFSYWNILYYSGFYLASVVSLYAGHMMVAFLCQIILFMPKILPSIAMLKKFTKCTQGLRKLYM